MEVIFFYYRNSVTWNEATEIVAETHVQERETENVRRREKDGGMKEKR